MTPRAVLAYVKKKGVVLMAAKGPVPSLAEKIAGKPFRGSWWGHPKSQEMFNLFNVVCESKDVLVCRLVDGKMTYVHRRLWPALVRLSSAFPKAGLAAIREEHTASGKHRVVATSFPRWVPKPVLARGRVMDLEAARAALGAAAGATGRPPGRRPAR